MDFFEFNKTNSNSRTQSVSLPINCSIDANTECTHVKHSKTIPELSPLQLPDSLDIYVPPIRKIKSHPDIIFKPNEPGILIPTILFLDYSSSMQSLGNEPPDSCKYYIQTLYDTAMNEPNSEIREKLLNVNVRLILFNETYREILNDSVRNLNIMLCRKIQLLKIWLLFPMVKTIQDLIDLNTCLDNLKMQSLPDGLLNL